MPACSPQTRLMISDPASAAKNVAQVIIEVIKSRTEHGRKAVLGLSADDATRDIYAELAVRNCAGDASFDNVVVFNTDELLGLGAHHPQSRARLMMQHLYSPDVVGRARMYSPSGQTLDQINTCRSYDAAIAHRGHLDLVLLILQPNGALGLVGPGSSPTAGTRMVILPIETRLALAEHFPTFDHVPTHALSIGLATIMAARQVVLLAIDHERAEAVEALVEGEVIGQWPCSLLQEHPSVTIICDEAAASRLGPGTLRRLVVPSSAGFPADAHPHHEVKLDGLAKAIFTPVDTPTDEIDIHLGDAERVADGDGEGYDVVEEMKV